MQTVLWGHLEVYHDVRRARGAAGSWPGGDGLTTLPCAHGALGGSRLWEHLLGASQIVVPCVLLWTWASINTI